MHREYVAVAGHGPWLAVLFFFKFCCIGKEKIRASRVIKKPGTISGRTSSISSDGS